MVADGMVTEEAPSGGAPTVVVELAVPAGRLAGTVARLRADGHHVLRVRPDGPVPSGEAPEGRIRAEEVTR